LFGNFERSTTQNLRETLAAEIEEARKWCLARTKRLKLKVCWIDIALLKMVFGLFC
jgi:energy-converting hydrogenase A subunit M